MVDVADRLSVAVRAEPFDIIEGEFRTRGYDQIVVFYLRPIRHTHAFVRGINFLCPADNQVDVSLAEGFCQVDRDVLAIPPPYHHPGIGRLELVVVRFADDRNLMVPPEGLFDFVGGDQSA